MNRFYLMSEMAQHARLKIDAGLQLYLCDPQSPWQRATNENTNGLLRPYFPNGSDLSVHSADEIALVAAALDTRPRKTLKWKTPAEALDELLQNQQPARCDDPLNRIGCRGLTASVAEYLPEAQWQRCMVHFYRNIFSHVPATKVRDVSHMLKAIHA